jgi:hypothetical protein
MSVSLSESRLIELEKEIGEADAESVAVIAFAAIHRIGELGRPAGRAFARLVEGVDEDPDMREIGEGLGLISWRRD